MSHELGRAVVRIIATLHNRYYPRNTETLQGSLTQNFDSRDSQLRSESAQAKAASGLDWVRLHMTRSLCWNYVWQRKILSSVPHEITLHAHVVLMHGVAL